MIRMNVRQVRALYADVADMALDTELELYGSDPVGEEEVGMSEEYRGAVELRIPSDETGDYLFCDGSTGY